MEDMSQGNSCPDQISTINLRVVDHDDALLTNLYAAAMWMSPRTRLRIDPTSTHDYSATVIAPTAPPNVPWALHLTDSNNQYKLLAFDFDTATHGPGVALADADRLAHELTELGVRHLRTTSGPTGGQHLWVSLSEATQPVDVKTLAHALSAHYPSLDISPLCNPVTGAVRGPGAPHRAGGHALPCLRGHALSEALAAMRPGTPSAVIGWLLARHPHPTPLSGAARRSTQIRIIESADGPRLDRPRRSLSARTRLLMATPLSKDCDRSTVAFSILLGMARSGRTLKDVEAALTAPGLIRLYEDKNAGHSFTLAKQWSRAIEAAAVFAPSVVDVHSDTWDELDAQLDTIVDALHRNSAAFARPGGPSDERILHALVQLARTARTTTLDIDCRRLAHATGLDASTISRRMRALEAAAWVSQVQAGSGTAGATWKLNPPPAEYCTGATQVEHAPAPPPPDTLLAHHAHDLWTPAPGLGPAYARIHLYLISGIDDTPGLAAVTGYSHRTVESAKKAFARLRLLPTSRSTAQTRRLQLHTAAQQIGVSGVLATRALRHVTERELFAWWTDELEWRRNRGKKRSGPRRYASGTIALPIETTPRGRYGRFPTIGGRADYTTARRIVTDYQSPRSALAA